MWTVHITEVQTIYKLILKTLLRDKYVGYYANQLQEI